MPSFPGVPREEDLLCLYRPRPGLPFTAYTLADGSKRLIWTTFTPQQIDIDVGQQITREYLLDVLDQFTTTGISQCGWMLWDMPSRPLARRAS